MQIAGAVAVVTGGTGSIGSAVCAALSAAGATAVAWDVAVDGGAEAVACDVTDARSVEEAMTTTVDRFGIPSILVTVAGVSGGFSPLASRASGDDWDRVLTAPDVWSRVLAINVVGVANCMRSFARHLASTARPGSIVNVSSMSGGPQAEPGLAAYSASKAAVNQLTRVAAAELGPLGIRVNAIGPGLMETPMGVTSGAQTRSGEARPTSIGSELARHHPIEHRLGRSDDIAEAVVALIGAGWITGQVVLADGGLTLRSPVTT